MWIKPAPGLCVRDPVTKHLLPSEGMEFADNGGEPPLPVDPVWSFYEAHGDVIFGEAPKAPAEHAPDTDHHA